MPSKPLKSLVRANRILERLVEMKTASVRELADEFDMPLSTMYEYINTLETLNHITKQADGRYRVATSFLEVGNRVRRDNEIYRTAEPELRRLAEETGEFAGLMIEENNLGVLLSMKKGEKVKRLQVSRTYPGVKSRLHTTAYGKAILSQLPDEEIRAIIEQYGLYPKTENTITDVESLLDEMELVRQRGYAFDDEECFDGMRGIGVPITSQSDDMHAGIAVYGPPNRLDDEVFFEEYPSVVQEYANIIRGNREYS
ncbi:IclR family transcriptional regulator [Haloarchaeobius sp. HME9146]|uniref:IclR family transcriptional regulator n=1 Tax=Haloarchaeobius sp. HME9146 TaxID=2978732 RepID=UPI0021C0ABEA|nr:IclR family transcriptional regulator [Haloarchaeobius sp. HME9146]MCT9098074.1 IclR family transcriptional regulator [Haloarchaeobius sp. HME9146]